MGYVIPGPPIRPTRFPELGYVNDEPGLWRFVDLKGGHPDGRVGPHYETKAALLADMERYAEFFGCKEGGAT